MYLGPPCYGYTSNCHLVYLAIPGTRPLCMKKQNLFVLIICNCKKVKFKSVQINMKHVLYYMRFDKGKWQWGKFHVCWSLSKKVIYIVLYY